MTPRPHPLRTGIAGRVLTLLLVIAALIDPQIASRHGVSTLSVLMDVSDSNSVAGREASWSTLRKQLVGLPDSSAIEVVQFAEHPVTIAPRGSKLPPVTMDRSPAITGRGTDIEAAIRHALQGADNDRASAMLLVSDGLANRGDVERALAVSRIRSAKLLWWQPGIDASQRPARLKVNFPQRVQTNSSAMLEVQIEAVAGTRGQVAVRLGKRQLEPLEFSVSADTGEQLQIPLDFSQPGFQQVEVDLRIDGTVVDQRVGLVEVAGLSRILYLSAEPSPAVAASLRLGGWPVQLRHPTALKHTDLQAADLVIVQDIPVDALNRQTWNALVDAVFRDGLGLVLLGGAHSYANGGYRHSILERALPLVAEARRPRATAAVVFLEDISGSMGRLHASSGRKRIDIANQAVFETARRLEASDQFALVTFEADASTRIPLGPAHSARLAKIHQTGVEPAGGTRLASGIRLALQQLQASTAQQKLIVLVSDGRTEGAAELQTIASQLAQTDVSLVTLAIDTDARLEELSALKSLSGINDGRFALVENTLDLPTLMQQELAVKRDARISEPSNPQTVRPFPFAAQTTLWPPLEGYMLARARKQATVYLSAASGAPIAAGWQYGNGRVLAFTTELLDWQRDWAEWGRFLGAMTEWAGGTRNAAELFARHSNGQDTVWIKLDVVDTEQQWSSGRHFDITLKDPAGQLHTVPLQATAPGRYEVQLTSTIEGRYDYWIRESNSATGIQLHRAFYHQALAERQTESPQLLQLYRAVKEGSVVKIDPDRSALVEAFPPGHKGLRKPLLLVALLAFLLTLIVERNLHGIWRDQLLSALQRHDR